MAFTVRQHTANRVPASMVPKVAVEISVLNLRSAPRTVFYRRTLKTSRISEMPNARKETRGAVCGAKL